MNIKEKFKEGIFTDNPSLIQLIGLCSILAISTSLKNSLGMGLSVITVLVLSNFVISLLRGFIPDDIRIPAFIVVVASFVTILQMVLEAFVPDLYDSLGIFLPLIVVNCIILGRAEAFAYKNGVLASIIDGVANGIGYTFAIAAVAFIRELLGSGQILGNQVIPEAYTIPFFTQAASAFIVLGVVIAIVQTILAKQKEKNRVPHVTECNVEGGK